MAANTREIRNPTSSAMSRYPKTTQGFTADPSPDDTPIGSGAVTEPKKASERNTNIPNANNAVGNGSRFIFPNSLIPGVNQSRTLSPARPMPKHIMKVAKLRARVQKRLVKKTVGSSAPGGNGT